jgi:hypothetical protein
MFKHGASESRFESFINLEMTLYDGILEFNIENTKEQNGKKLEHEVSMKCEETMFKMFLKINLRQYANL